MTSRKLRHYLRAHVIGLAAIFIALSGTAIAGQGEPTASSSAAGVTKAKFKKLKQRVGALEGKLNTPARGDLTGVYPDLQIATNAVTTNKIAKDAVTSEKIVDNAVNDAKLAANSVGSSELKQVTVKTGTTTAVNAGTASGALSADCAVGEQAFASGGQWSDLSNTGVGLAISSMGQGFGVHSTLVNVANVSGTNRSFTPQVFCLDA